MAELDRHPPRFAVALAYAHEGIDSAEFFEARGYHRLPQISTPSFIVLER